MRMVSMAIWCLCVLGGACYPGASSRAPAAASSRAPAATSSRAPAAAAASAGSAWTYPELVNTWEHSGYPECATGTVQSPVDLSCTACLPAQHAMATVVVPIIKLVPTTQEDPHNFSFPLPAAMGPRFMTVNGTKWHVKEFHFHVPAEDRIAAPLGGPGPGAPQMEVHVKTVLETDPHTYAVFAVVLQETPAPPGGPDPGAWLEPILHLLEGRAPDVFTLGDPTPPITPASGPLVYFDTQPFWSFPGSLTTPPCTAVSDWFVSTRAFPIGVGQAARFSVLLEKQFHTAHNARGLQPIGARPMIQYRPRDADASTGGGAHPH